MAKKWPKIAPKWPKIAQIAQKWPKVAQKLAPSEKYICRICRFLHLFYPAETTFTTLTKQSWKTLDWVGLGSSSTDGRTSNRVTQLSFAKQQQQQIF